MPKPVPPDIVTMSLPLTISLHRQDMINYGDADEEANVLVHPTTVGGFAAVATRPIRKGEEVGPCSRKSGTPARHCNAL